MFLERAFGSPGTRARTVDPRTFIQHPASRSGVCSLGATVDSAGAAGPGFEPQSWPSATEDAADSAFGYTKWATASWCSTSPKSLGVLPLGRETDSQIKQLRRAAFKVDGSPRMAARSNRQMPIYFVAQLVYSRIRRCAHPHFSGSSAE